MDFSKIAPYLKDPLVLIGFFILLFFSFARFIIKQGLIPQLTKKHGYRVLQTVLLYGFIVGLAIILLGFGLKYRELSEQEQRNAVGLLSQEFSTNMGIVGQLSENTQTLLQLMSNTAVALRTPGIKLLPALFPEENLDLKKTAKPPTVLANEAMDSLERNQLHLNQPELNKLTAAGRLIRSTVAKTIGTVRSLADTDRRRYVMHNEIWQAQLPMLRKINILPVTPFQESYAELDKLRANYDILVARVIDYLESLRDFFSDDGEITRDRLAAVLTAERLAFQIVAAYGNDLAYETEKLVKLQRQLHTQAEWPPNPASSGRESRLRATPAAELDRRSAIGDADSRWP